MTDTPTIYDELYRLDLMPIIGGGIENEESGEGWELLSFKCSSDREWFIRLAGANDEDYLNVGDYQFESITAAIPFEDVPGIVARLRVL